MCLESQVKPVMCYYRLQSIVALQDNIHARAQL
jgi:hypothetical protein